MAGYWPSSFFFFVFMDQDSLQLVTNFKGKLKTYLFSKAFLLFPFGTKPVSRAGKMELSFPLG